MGTTCFNQNDHIDPPPSEIKQEIITYMKKPSINELSEFSNQSSILSTVRDDSKMQSQVLVTYKSIQKLKPNVLLSILYSKCRIERPQQLKDGLFIGQWNQRTMNGQGKMYYTNGDYYEGFWLMGQRHHWGVYIYKNGKHLSGTWFADQYLGDQEYEFMSDETIQIKVKQLKQQPHNKQTEEYTQWVTPEGFGIIEYPNKEFYYGFLENDVPNGYGIQFRKGELYRGEFFQGLKHGLGHLQSQQIVFIGLFQYDRLTNDNVYSIQI